MIASATTIVRIAPRSRPLPRPLPGFPSLSPGEADGTRDVDEKRPADQQQSGNPEQPVRRAVSSTPEPPAHRRFPPRSRGAAGAAARCAPRARSRSRCRRASTRSMTTIAPSAETNSERVTGPSAAPPMRRRARIPGGRASRASARGHTEACANGNTRRSSRKIEYMDPHRFEKYEG